MPFVVRNDDAVFTVMDGESCMLDYLKDDDGIETLTPHLADIRERMTALIEACEVELRGRLPMAELSAFPGFPIGRMEKGPVRNLRVADEWLVATGSATHFSLAEPRVERCVLARNRERRLLHVRSPERPVRNRPHFCRLGPRGYFTWGTVGTFIDPDGNACELKNADDPFFS